MKLKFYFLTLVLLFAGVLVAQNDNLEGDEIYVEDSTSLVSGSFVPIEDDMTVDPEQNKKWRKGLYKYPAKPKHAWELGLHGGHYFIDGDVDEKKGLAGFGLGLHLRRAIHYAFSVRFDLFYGQTYGVDPQKSTDGLVESTFKPYGNGLTGLGWYAKYKTEFVSASILGVLNIGNILFHKERNKWNWIAFAGVGLNSNQTMLDLLDGNGNPYNVSSIDRLPSPGESRQNRIDRVNAINKLYDGKYETAAYRKQAIYRINDKYHIHADAVLGMGVYRKITKRINIGLEHQVMIADNDYLDGIKNRTKYDQTNQNDINHYTNIRLAVNIANFNKRTEPLYWLNPLDFAYNDIANLKQRPVFDLTDSDGDGVIDMMDMEQESPVGCPVDTRGVILDSDGDGLTDCKDKEPYSPPGYEVDEVGVAQIPKEENCCVTKEEVKKMFNESFSRGGVPTNNGVVYANSGTGVSDWFLPMIHFDLDKYYLKAQYSGHLKHVAEVMKKYPNMCVTAFGATDVRNSNAYNEMLSYNRSKTAIDFLVNHYGIDRSRFNLMYGGEEKQLVPNLPDSHNTSKEIEMGHYMNRRVEFRTCRADDYDMPRPSGVIDAGKNSPGSSRIGSKYSGNKNSGF